MSLTALEIKQRTFAKSLRGYDVNEVNAFLGTIANEWENNVGKMKDLEREVKLINYKLAHYQRIEATLHETLQTARDNAAQKMDNARRDAANRVEKAEMEATQIVLEARQKRQEIRAEVIQLLERRKEVMGGIESFLESARKSLESFKQDESGVFRPLTEVKQENEEIKNKKPDRQKQESPEAPGMENLDGLLDDID
jgi:cell division initiation protein